MLKVYIVRHGQTDCNLYSLFQGQSDVDLNSTGREEAARLGQYLAAQKISFDFVWSSDLQRCVHTAEIALSHLENGAAVQREWTVDGRERSVGELELMTWDDASKKCAREGKEIADYGEVS